MSTKVLLELSIPDDRRGRRLDQVLAELVQDYSRSRLQQWIRSGQVTLDGRLPQPRDKVMGGETVLIDAEIVEQTASEAEAIPLDLVYEDADLLVINKPAGLVVHPAAGNPAGTLLNALLHYDSSLAGILNSLTPLFTLIVGLVIYRRAAKWINIFGLLIGLVGAIGLIWKGGTDILKGINLYALFIVVATICYGINVNEIKYKLAKLYPG